MKIDAYEFGCIEIDGRRFTTDVIVTPETVLDHWWRKEGHRLAPEDLNAVIAARPDTLVLGTGAYGNMEVPAETREFLAARGIEVLAQPTRDAVAAFNRLARESARIVAALHLTC